MDLLVDADTAGGVQQAVSPRRPRRRPRVMALMAALAGFTHIVAGFSNRRL